MSGVIVLNIIEKGNNYIWPFDNVVFSIMMLAGILCSILFCSFLGDHKYKAALLTFIVACLCFIGCYIWYDVHKNTPERTQYEVMVSDEVKLNEFLEHYKIIDQRGEIFIVEEINNGRHT